MNFTTIDFAARPQPSFNKNFDMLIKDLNANTAAGYINFLFAENPKQIERFYSIFKDLKAEVKFVPINKVIHSGYVDDDLKIACYTDHQIFNRYHKYAVKTSFSRDTAMLLKQLRDLKPGDYVTHIDHGVGIYCGLQKMKVGDKMQEAVRLEYAGGDLLYVSIHSLHKISKYTGKEGQAPRVHKLGSNVWENIKKKTKTRIKEIAFDLIQLYAKRKASKGFQFAPDTYMQNELEASFIYEDTPDQMKSTADVKADMESQSPMDRLVCGDVGFGKTEIAVRAACKAVADGKQVAVLVPTTILAYQHYETFKDRLKDFPIEIDFLNRFKSAAEKKLISKKLEDGKLNIIIGTHGLIGKNIKFKDLGLLIIDEEQKFGVGVKEKLKDLKANIDTLTLTATPIPRTLQFSLMGARDLSIIETPPPNRQPVETEVLQFNADAIKEAIEFEIFRGGQVFFVHNRVKELLEYQLMLKAICPDIDIAVAHGQMEGDKLEETILKFIKREYDLLLCTNIIESGIDIPNANTIIINDAHMFGLSDLHQLRGRVGRSNKKAFCYLFRPPLSSLGKDAKLRLKTIEEFAALGSGLNIAMRDLDIRGAGNILGGEQSGFITDIGFETYHKILDEAIMELKETEFADLYKDEVEQKKNYVRDCQIDADLEMLIPDSYIKNVNERMSLYAELNAIKNEEGINTFKEKLIDRFGPLPEQVEELFNGLRLKWLATQLGMERIIFNKQSLKCYFIENQQSVFYSSKTFAAVMQFIQKHHREFSLKQTDKHLILAIQNVKSMKSAFEKLGEMNALQV